MPEFQLLIKPTSYECNLNCTYCFYKRVELVYPAVECPRMSVEVAENIIQKYLNERLNNSIFCWQGGEPTLMGLDFYRTVIELQKRYGKGGQSVSNILQTNGILLNEEWASFLHDYKFFVGLSLDGPQKIHDRFRITKNGSGTWNKVMNSAEILREFNVEFNILCVISKANVNNANELYKFFRENEFDYLQFIPALECTNDKMAPFSPTKEEYGKFLCEMFDLWRKNGFETVHIRTFENLLSTYLGQLMDSCPFGEKCSDYIVIEWNGNVFPCDFYVRQDLKLGNLLNDDFSIIMEKREKIFAYKKKKLGNECLNCHWKNLCFGGCLKDRDFCNNKGINKSYYCAAYKTFFTHSYEWFIQTRDRVLHEKGLPSVPVVNKIGRNDDCPCGSGLKYKKCHGKKSKLGKKTKS
ncbi:MAG: anaerobic sulfatase maturase [Candidatus Helarchaeota archaeon]